MLQGALLNYVLNKTVRCQGNVDQQHLKIDPRQQHLYWYTYSILPAPSKKCTFKEVNVEIAERKSSQLTL
jgi:hypothetical protein